MPLVLSMADQDRAIGNAVRFFRFAQERHKSGKLISEDEFQKQGFSEALIGLFAERVDGGIKCFGADKHFDWLKKKRSAGAKGGRSKAEAKTKHLKQNQSKTTEANRSKAEASYSSSYSSSVSNFPSSLVNESPADAVVPADLALNAEIWKSYSEAYEVRYKTKPVRNARVNGQIAQFAKRLGKEAPAVARFYLSLAKSYYVAKVHDFGLCLGDAEALRTQWATGRTVTQKEAQQADSAQTLANQMKKYGEAK